MSTNQNQKNQNEKGDNRSTDQSHTYSPIKSDRFSYPSDKLKNK